MRQILGARKESNKRTPLLRGVVADGAAQHRIRGLERVEDGSLCHFTLDVELHLAADF